MECMGRRLSLPPAGGCNGGSGVVAGGYLRLPSLEQPGAIYFNKDHCGPVSVGKLEARAKSDNAVVLTGGSGFGGDVDGSPGGRAEVGGDKNSTETATNDLLSGEDTVVNIILGTDHYAPFPMLQGWKSTTR